MSSVHNAVVLGGARTPFTKAFGTFSRVPARELAATAIREAVARAGVTSSQVDAVVVGNVAGPPDASNIARVAALLAGLDETTPALTVNRNCASGMESIVQAARLIRDGEAGVVVAAGAESMSAVPFLFRDPAKEIFLAAQRARSLGARLSIFSRLRPRHFSPLAGLEVGLRDPNCGLSMGETAEILAARFGISREDQDAFALESHQKTSEGKERLAGEIAPVYLSGKGGTLVTEDVGPRERQSLPALAKLKPVFDRRRGTVTAGNASPITDGAAALVLAAPGKVASAAPDGGPMGRISAWATAALSPRVMGLGPVHATSRLLEREKTTLDTMDLVEINEAFAAQVLACQAAFGSDRYFQDELDLPSAPGPVAPERLNVNGGAIALGHPVGASGTRLVLTLLREIRRRGSRRGLASLCVGGGQGMSIMVEAL